jgi:O-antigen/teichoic acid export membrane protein
LKAWLAEQESVHEPAGLMVMARLCNVAVGMATVPALIHFLGPGGFAAWALLLAMSFAFTGLEMGLAPSFVKHAAPLLRAREWRAANGMLSSAFAMLVLVFGLVAVPVSALAPWIAGELQLPVGEALSAPSLVLVVYGAVALRSLLQFGVHTLAAARRFRAVAAATFLQSLCANLASAIVAGLTRRLDLALLAFWGGQLLVVAAFFLLSRRVLEDRAGTPSMDAVRKLMPHGFKIQLGDWAQVITFQFDKFIIASWLGLVHVAAYEVANRSILALRSIPSSGLESFLPSAAIGQSEPGEVWDRYLAVTRLAATAVTVFMLAPLAIAPLFLYAWTGEVGYDARGVFAALFVGFAANVLALPAAAMVQAAGRADLQARAAIATMLVNVPLSVLLLWQWGMPGAALGTALAMTTGACLLLASMHRAYGRSLATTLSMLAGYWPAALACVLVAVAADYAFEQWFAAVPPGMRNGWSARLPLAGVAIAAYFACAALMLALQLRRGQQTRRQLLDAARWLRGLALSAPEPAPRPQG